MFRIEEPTCEQCSANSKVYTGDSVVGYAVWYPQLGGYVGKAVALISDDSCFDVLVWHDGEFPFRGEGGYSPRELHHCDPDQFIRFGKKIMEFQSKELENV